MNIMAENMNSESDTLPVIPTLPDFGNEAEWSVQVTSLEGEHKAVLSVAPSLTEGRYWVSLLHLGGNKYGRITSADGVIETIDIVELLGTMGYAVPSEHSWQRKSATPQSQNPWCS